MDLNQGDVIDNEQLCNLFKCSTQGGMRRSLETNTLVVVSNHVKSIYNDRWINGIFHYTGMGTIGDQSLEFMQNKTLNESNTNGVTVHLFEVFKKGQYTYIGLVQLASDPYSETQPDENGKNRQVWMFPLELTDGAAPVIAKEVTDDLEAIKEKKAKKLSDDELVKLAKSSPKRPGSKNVSSNQYDRNPWIKELAKRRANGVCQLCDEPAPFNSKDGSPYLEIHHVEWLAKGGDDSIDNTVALCPNCHRKMHIVEDRHDVEKLKEIASRPV